MSLKRNCPLQRGTVLPKGTPSPMEQPTSNDWRTQEYKGPVSLPQFGTFLKGPHSSRDAHRISCDPSCNLTAGQLCHLSKPTFLSTAQVCLPRALFSKPSGYNSPFQSPSPGNPIEKEQHVPNRAKPLRLERRGRATNGRGRCKPQGRLYVCSVWKGLYHTHDLAENGLSQSSHQLL